MYTPTQNEETRTDVMQSLIRTHSLGVWVSMGDGELIANHIPFDIDPARGEFGTLVGHVARGNPIWRQPPSTIPSLVIFQGPQGYVTPSWYPSKHEHGKAVPTWNYAVVHVSGVPVFIQDKSWLHEHVSRLTDRHEASQALPWAVSDAPGDYVEKQIAAIVGVEIPIEKLTGKWKMSQNRSMPDQLGVVAGLLARQDPQAAEVAAVMQGNLRPSFP
jgi:transcriptional regulator